MDDARRLGADEPVGVHMRHDIVPHLRLALGDGIVVNVVDVFREFIRLLGRDGQTQRMLRARKAHPELPPGGIAHVRREQPLHLV